MAESFILGLSSGSACLLTCAMVMFPFILSGTSGVKTIAADVALFLVARLIIYFVLATVAWHFGKTVFSSPIMRNIIPGVLYIVLAVMLVWYSIERNRSKVCQAKIVSAVNNKRLVPVLTGVVNSVGFCPALLIIITDVATKSSVFQSYMAFLAFFAGSSLWFLVLPFTGMIRRKNVLVTVGILATGLAGIIYLIKGLTNLLGGLING